MFQCFLSPQKICSILFWGLSKHCRSTLFCSALAALALYCSCSSSFILFIRAYHSPSDVRHRSPPVTSGCVEPLIPHGSEVDPLSHISWLRIETLSRLFARESKCTSVFVGRRVYPTTIRGTSPTLPSSPALARALAHTSSCEAFIWPVVLGS